MKDRFEPKMGLDKLDHEDGAGAHIWEDKHEHKPHTVEDHQEGEEVLTNYDVKDDLDALV